MERKIKFEAIIQKRGIQNGAYVDFPFSTKELYRRQGNVRVLAMIDGQGVYRGTLTPTAQGTHSLNLTLAIRQQVGKTFGDTISVELWRELPERNLEVPEDMQAALEANPKAKARFEKLDHSDRQEFIRWVSKAHKPESRESRRNKMLEMVLAGQVRE